MVSTFQQTHGGWFWVGLRLLGILCILWLNCIFSIDIRSGNCTSDNPCDVGRGFCTSDKVCKNDLKCGGKNFCQMEEKSKLKENFKCCYKSNSKNNMSVKWEIV